MVEQVVVPVEVGVVHIGFYTTSVLNDGPWSFGIFCFVESSSFQFFVVVGSEPGVGDTVV